MNEIMLDIETLSTESNAKILSIAAIKFNRDDICTTSILKDKELSFYRKIELSSYDSYEDNKFHVDPKTVDWWRAQQADVRDEAVGGENRDPIKLVLLELSAFFGKCEKVWANGSCFDCVIIENAFKTVGLNSPWKFWNVRDCRTIYDLANVSLKNIEKIYPECKDFPAHHALYDAYKQTLIVQLAVRKLK